MSSVLKFSIISHWWFVASSSFLVLGSWLLTLGSAQAQQKNIPLNYQWSLNFEGSLLHDSATQNTFSSFKPFIETQSKNLYDYNLSNCKYSICLTRKEIGRNLLYRKLKKESLFIVKDSTDQFHLTIDPLFNLEIGKDLQDSTGQKLFKNTRGILVRGDIGKNFSFESSFYENQAIFPNYISNFNETYLVVPGQGRWKRFKTKGYDFAMSSGYISYSPTIKNENWYSNIQLGHGKHFVGDGYRSLLLSDNSFNYPYVRVTTQYKKFQYTNLYTLFMNLNDGGVTTPPNTERLFQKKAGSFQYLSWNVHKRFQLGLFQGMIWEASDDQNKQQFNFNYFNPIITSSAFVYGTRNTNNIVLGSTAKIILFKGLYIYGQYMLDDIAKDNLKGSINNKQGMQAGIKYFDAFKLKNLHLQLEYNKVRPYAYAHKKPEQSYSHYNQALSHPLGANFKEVIGVLNYRVGDFFTQFKINYAMVGRDSAAISYGNTIFNSDNNSFYGPNSNINEQNQGMATNITNVDFHIGYLINPTTNMNIVLGVLNRNESYGNTTNTTNFIYVGLRTSLNNIYYDF